MSRITQPSNVVARFAIDQLGITGLETAIVLVAFVVVAAVFAFGVLNTGLISSEKSEEASLSGCKKPRLP